MDRECRDMDRFLRRSPQKPPNPSSNNHPSGTAKKVLYEQNESSSSSSSSPSSSTSHPVYKSIGLINGQINRMDLSTMKNRCHELNLDTRGKPETIKRRLKEYYKVAKLTEVGLISPRVNRNVDYFIIVDFEATCERRNPPGYPHEIIEFPAVLVSSEAMKIVDVFHSYIRPVINPILSEFCTSLTGIGQSTVDSSDPFPVVHDRFLNWLSAHDLGSKYSFSLVTDGPFDMGRFLYLQIQHCRMEYPKYGTAWVNLRKCFGNFYSSSKLRSLQMMLDYLGLEFEGSPHSGIDDAKNIARIVIRLLADRAHIRINEKIVLEEKEQRQIKLNQSRFHSSNNNNNNNNGDRYHHHHQEQQQQNNPGPGRLLTVVPVSQKEAEKWFFCQQKVIAAKSGTRNCDQPHF